MVSWRSEAVQKPVNIAEVLAQYGSNCPALDGAVVATHDGLVLGATESFMGDTPAAAAASLGVHLEQDLAWCGPSLACGTCAACRTSTCCWRELSQMPKRVHCAWRGRLQRSNLRPCSQKLERPQLWSDDTA